MLYLSTQVLLMFPQFNIFKKKCCLDKNVKKKIHFFVFLHFPEETILFRIIMNTPASFKFVQRKQRQNGKVNDSGIFIISIISLTKLVFDSFIFFPNLFSSDFRCNRGCNRKTVKSILLLILSCFIEICPPDMRILT